MLRLRLNLTVTILAFLSGLLIMTWLLFSLLALKTAANDLYSQKGEQAGALLAVFAGQLPDEVPVFPDGMLRPDSPAAQFAQRLADDGVITRLSLLDINGKAIYSVGREGSDVYLPFASPLHESGRGGVLPGDSDIVRTVTIKRNNVAVGKAGIVVPLLAEKARLKRSRTLFMSYFAIDFILLLGLGAFILSRIVVTPISRLLSATEKIIDGHYGQSVRISGCAEIARLAESFNDMSRTLLSKQQQVTEHVAALEKANQELRQAREEAVRTEKMASIGLLAAGMAHEIGTPLASIMGYAELLASEAQDSPAVQDFSRRITSDSVRIDRIVRGLLDYAKPRGTSQDRCQVGRLVSESVEMLKEQGAFKQVQVSISCDEVLPGALIDSHQLQQVLVNLLMNARDAVAENGQIAVRIKRDTAPDGVSMVASGIRIDVLDNGTGIPEAHQQRIFDPFFTTKPPGKGTGLGLAISSRIIEGFGGRIAVRSKPGSGTCFTLWLPAEAVPGEGE